MRVKATAEEMSEFIFRHGLADKFDRWVKQYRAGKDLKKLSENIDASEKAFNRYLELMEKTNAETDPVKKRDLRWETIEAYGKYQRIEEEHKRLQNRIDKGLGLKEEGKK